LYVASVRIGRMLRDKHNLFELWTWREAESERNCCLSTRGNKACLKLVCA
jgi:hypothetical protein